MDIPRAYDVLPSNQQQQQHAHGVSVANGGGGYGAPYGAHSASVVAVDGGGDAHQSLLLNEQEAQWQQEMAQEGIGHLPVSWYRQTPKQALTSVYGAANIIINGLINFGLNAGIGYAVLHDNDEVGLWQEPKKGDHPYKSAAFSDLIITTFLINFLICLISTPGIRSAMKKGQTVPVENHAMEGGLWSCTPVRLLGTCTRSLMLSLWAMVFVYLPFLALLQIICSAGGMNGSGSQCSFEVHTYIWLKATFSVFVAAIAYALVLLATLNVKTLPPLDLTFFIDNQKLKWEEKQRKEVPQPL